MNYQGLASKSHFVEPGDDFMLTFSALQESVKNKITRTSNFLLISHRSDVGIKALSTAYIVYAAPESIWPRLVIMLRNFSKMIFKIRDNKLILNLETARVCYIRLYSAHSQ